MDTLTTQVGGDHYKDMPIQPTEFIHANGIGFIEGNIIKYLCRHRRKNGKQDLEKAAHYLQMLIAMEYPETIFPASRKWSDDDGWIPWTGGDCPVSDSAIVHFKLRREMPSVGPITEPERAGCLNWANSGCASDIIAYKLA